MYKTHKCPLEVNDISDVGVLQDLMNSDERMFIRLKILDNICRRIINARNADVNEDYLRMMYGYMKRFHIYIEIQSICLDMMIHVANEGSLHILNACEGIMQYLEEYLSNNVLHDKAEILLLKLRKVSDAKQKQAGDALLELHRASLAGNGHY